MTGQFQYSTIASNTATYNIAPKNERPTIANMALLQLPMHNKDAKMVLPTAARQSMDDSVFFMQMLDISDFFISKIFLKRTSNQYHDSL